MLSKYLKKIKKQAGFSLVELMVVVAIIGILASVAIPSFNKFQRRARAAEAKNALSALYQSQKSFLAEWEDYSSSLATIGYTYEGSTRSQVDTGGTGLTAAARYTTEAPAAWTNTQGANRNRLSTLCGNATFMPACVAAANTSTAWGSNINYTGRTFSQGAAGTPGTFTAAAATNVGSSTDEVWRMNHAKQLVQGRDGVNAN